MFSDILQIWRDTKEKPEEYISYKIFWGVSCSNQLLVYTHLCQHDRIFYELQELNQYTWYVIPYLLSNERSHLVQCLNDDN